MSMQMRPVDLSECVNMWLKVGCDAVDEKDHPIWIKNSPEDIGNALIGHPKSALRQFEWGHFEKVVLQLIYVSESNRWHTTFCKVQHSSRLLTTLSSHTKKRRNA